MHDNAFLSSLSYIPRFLFIKINEKYEFWSYVSQYRVFLFSFLIFQQLTSLDISQNYDNWDILFCTELLIDVMTLT